MSNPANKTHPMVIIAAGAVTLLCAAGIASIMGWIPTAGSENKPAAPHITAAAPAAALTAPPSAAPEVKPAEAPVVKEEPKPVEAPKPVAQAPKPAAPKPAVKPAPAPAPAPVAQQSPPTPVYVANAPASSQPEKRICANCGSVSSITPVEKKGEGSGAGVVIGGIVGGVLGHQVGGGRGKDVATVAGALGGAYAGNEIEKNNKRSMHYEVRVHMEDGTYRTVRYDSEPGLRIGDKVRIENGRLVRG